MTVINVTLPLGAVKSVDDFSKIINEILKQEITFNILKFSTESSGTNLLLDIPEDKISQVTSLLKENDVKVNKKGIISIDKELCIECGSCVSLCPTDALQLDEEFLHVFYEDKCIGCLLCLDACPRFAIEKS